MAAIFNLCKLGLSRILNICTNIVVIVFVDSENIGADTRFKSPRVPHPEIHANVVLMAAIFNLCKLEEVIYANKVCRII